MKWPLRMPITCAKITPFVDGNKRTALTTALIFLELNGISILDPRGRLENAMIRMASGELNKENFAKVL